MKNITYLILIATVSFSCTDYGLEDNVLKVKQIGSYVAFANTGGTVTPIVRTLTENSAISNLRIENATGSLSSITVTYEFSGTAVLGTDFTVTSPGGTATATGGTIVITATNKKTTVNDFAFVNLGIDAITDGVVDGAKTLTVTLVSAVNADGKVFDVGRGAAESTIYLQSAVLNISDIN
jgi:hypothetical protein